MPKGRTARPKHRTSKRALNVAAEKMAKAVQRHGIITKRELSDRYSSLINTDGVDDSEVKDTASVVAAMAADAHPQVKMKRGGLEWISVGRGNRAAAVLA